MSTKSPVSGVVTAQIIESLAAGLMMSLAIVYFAAMTDVPLGEIGLATAAAGILSLPLGVLGGMLCDRFGSRAAMVLNNLLAVVGYGLFLVANNAATIFVAVLLISIGDRIYWAIWTTFVKDLSEDKPYEEVFARFESIKMGVMGAGAAISAGVLAFGAVTGARWIVVANIALTIVAGAVYLRIKMPTARPVPEARTEPTGEKPPRMPVVRQAGFWPLVLGQFFLAPIMVLPNVALSVYFVNEWGMSPAVASVMFGVNAAIVAFTQTTVTRAVRFVPRATLIAVTCAILVGFLVVLALTPPLTGAAAWVYVCGVGVILGVGDTLYMPATNALMAEIPRVEFRGVSVSIFQTSMAVGMAVYPAALGILDVSPNLFWILTGASIVLGGVAYLVAVRSAPAEIRVAEVRATTSATV